MARKSGNPNFDQTLEKLRAHSFEVAPYPGVEKAVLVTKHGAGAVLVPGQSTSIAFHERPGAVFSEELSQSIGTISLYNESLGTTSDVYEYDRLKGRDPAEKAPVQPWEPAEGH